MDFTTGSLSEAAAMYVESNFALFIQKRSAFLTMIMDKKQNVNKGVRNGTLIKHPVGTTKAGTIGSLGTQNNPWAARSAGFTNQIDTTGRRYFQSEPKFAAFLMTQLEAPVAYTREMRDMYENSPASQASIVELMGKELMEYCVQTINTGIMGTAGDTNAARNTFLSLPYACKGNTLGGIVAATETFYQATNRTSSVVLTRSKLDFEIRYMQDYKMATPDLLLLSSNSAGSPLYEQAASFVDANTYYQKAPEAGGTANYGFDNYLYRNVMIAADKDLPVNEGYLLQTDQWYWDGKETPEKTDKYIIPLTTVEAETYYLFGCLSVRGIDKQMRMVLTA